MLGGELQLVTRFERLARTLCQSALLALSY